MKKLSFLSVLLLSVISVWAAGDAEEISNKVKYIEVEQVSGSPIVTIKNIDEFIDIAEEYDITNVFLQIEDEDTFYQKTYFSIINDGVVYRLYGYNYENLEEASRGISRNVYDKYLLGILDDFQVSKEGYAELKEHNLVTPESINSKSELLENNEAGNFYLPEELTEGQYLNRLLPIIASSIVEGNTLQRFADKYPEQLDLTTQYLDREINVPFYEIDEQKKESWVIATSRNSRRGTNNNRNNTDENENTDTFYFNYMIYTEILELLQNNESILNLYSKNDEKNVYELNEDFEGLSRIVEENNLTRKPVLFFRDSQNIKYYLTKLIEELNPGITREDVTLLFEWDTIELSKIKEIKDLGFKKRYDYNHALHYGIEDSSRYYFGRSYALLNNKEELKRQYNIRRRFNENEVLRNIERFHDQLLVNELIEIEEGSVYTIQKLTEKLEEDIRTLGNDRIRTILNRSIEDLPAFLEEFSELGVYRIENDVFMRL